jgi:hypothetical protein
MFCIIYFQAAAQGQILSTPITATLPNQGQNSTYFGT